jgi:hypothetical protein
MAREGLGKGNLEDWGARAAITPETAGGEILETIIGHAGRLDRKSGRHRALCCTVLHSAGQMQAEREKLGGATPTGLRDVKHYTVRS